MVNISSSPKRDNQNVTPFLYNNSFIRNGVTKRNDYSQVWICPQEKVGTLKWICRKHYVLPFFTACAVAVEEKRDTY